MDPAAPLLFFDSGVGGLSVLQPTRELLPNATFRVRGNDIVENRKGYSCWSREDPGCGFVIWKSKAGKNLPVAIAKELIATGRTAKPVTGFKGRSGKSFRARLALQQSEEGKWRVEFDEAWAKEGAKPPEVEDAAAESAVPPSAADAAAAAITEVDPARGSGHALGSARRGDNPRLRTRVGKDGMDYKGFNIAVHEMGHNVEQVFSLKDIDYYTLQGVPNTAFTEALAFVFQAKDLELLGLATPNAESSAGASGTTSTNGCGRSGTTASSAIRRCRRTRPRRCSTSAGHAGRRRRHGS